MAMTTPTSLSVATWRVQTARAVIVTAFIACAFSLQYPAQTFVWRNWPVAEVLVGWLYVLRDQLIVSTTVALSISAVWLVPNLSVRVRAVLLAFALLAGALIGEAIVRWRDGALSGIGFPATFALRWSAVALAVAGIYYLWRRSMAALEQLQGETLQRLQIEQQLANTRLIGLTRQIEPHFLFNTLATVRRLHRIEPESGARMLASFIDYLRRMMTMLDRTLIPLSEELAFLQAYLDIIVVRMEGRLTFEFDVPAALHQCLVPPLALATLVENAVKHGLAPSARGGHLTVSASMRGGNLLLCVADTGVGLKSDGGSGSGIGLSNIQSRLMTLYGPGASLRVLANTPTGVRATIVLPHAAIAPHQVLERHEAA